MAVQSHRQKTFFRIIGFDQKVPVDVGIALNDFPVMGLNFALTQRDLMFIRKPICQPITRLAGYLVRDFRPVDAYGQYIPILRGGFQIKTKNVKAFLLKLFAFWAVSSVAVRNISNFSFQDWFFIKQLSVRNDGCCDSGKGGRCCGNGRYDVKDVRFFSVSWLMCWRTRNLLTEF